MIKGPRFSIFHTKYRGLEPIGVAHATVCATFPPSLYLEATSEQLFKDATVVRVLILHFRSAPAEEWRRIQASADPLDSAGTDGVSLEIAKRQALLEEMGQEVAICSAYEWADYPMPPLEFDREEVARIVRGLFGATTQELANEAQVRAAFDASRLELKRQLGTIFDDFVPDMLFIHNVLSLPVHPAATVGVTELLRETGLPCAAIHHDVQSEGAYKFKPTSDFARAILEEYYPPMMPNLRHWTINTRNRTSLAHKGVAAEVIHDTMDFDHRLDLAEHERIRGRLRAKYAIEPDDVVLFVGARIVPNKQTELAGHLTVALDGFRRQIESSELYNGRSFSSNSRVILVLAGRPERAFVGYRKHLFALLDKLQINWRYVGDDVRPYRSADEGLYALYPDFYAIADFVLYLTGWEGVGNQLLEAFAAHLPVAVFEYPVFKEDIAPKGVRVVSLGDALSPLRDSTGLGLIGDDVLCRAAADIAAILTSPERFANITEHNDAVARRHFGVDVLRAHLEEAMRWAHSLRP